MPDSLVSVLLIFAGFLGCALTSLAFGLAALRALRVDLGKAEFLALGYVLGSAINSTLVLGLGLSGLIGKAVFIAIALISLVLLGLQANGLAIRRRASGGSVPWMVRILLLLAFVFYGVIYFRQALSPEISPDGAAYHLGLVNLWTHAGRIGRIADVVAAYPEGLEMLFLFAFAIGRHSAAALVHFSFLIDLPILMLLYGRRFGWSYFATGFAAILIFASPLFGTVGTVAYNDVALAAVCFAAIYLLQMWREERKWGVLVACGILGGFAVAVKYSAFPLPVAIAATVVWDLRREGFKKALRATAGVLAAAGVMCGPYFLRNWIWFANPVAPFANAVFPNQWFHVSMERAWRAQQASYGGVTWRDVAIGLTIGNAKLPNSFGMVFLLIPLSLTGLIWRQSRLLMLAGLSLTLIYSSSRDPRYLMPAMVFAAMGLGYALSRIRGGAALLCGITAIHLIASWPAFMDYAHFPPDWQWRLHPMLWRDALRITPESEYLSRLPDYAMARQVEALVPDGEPVLAFTSGMLQAYTTRRLVVSWHSAYGERMTDLLFANWHSPADYRKRYSFPLPHEGVKEIRVVQEAGDKVLMWNVDEIQLRLGGKLLPVSPAWRLNASPNPWDVRAAFDGKLATRWRSWDSLRPGMFISVDFGGSDGGATQKPDSVDVILDDREWATLGEGVWAAQISLDVLTGDGRHTRVLPRVTEDPPVDLRREAAEALKEGGIHYLLINQGDWQDGEFLQTPEAWNMHAVATGARATLFRLD